MSEEYAQAILETMYTQMKAQYGSAIKGRWFYSGAGCPGCGGKIDKFVFEGKENAISVNGFIFRERGILIGYVLCGTCAKKVLNAKREGALHKIIEGNLIDGYKGYLRGLDA